MTIRDPFDRTDLACTCPTLTEHLRHELEQVDAEPCELHQADEVAARRALRLADEARAEADNLREVHGMKPREQEATVLELFADDLRNRLTRGSTRSNLALNGEGILNAVRGDLGITHYDTPPDAA